LYFDNSISLSVYCHSDHRLPLNKPDNSEQGTASLDDLCLASSRETQSVPITVNSFLETNWSSTDILTDLSTLYLNRSLYSGSLQTLLIMTRALLCNCCGDPSFFEHILVDAIPPSQTLILCWLRELWARLWICFSYRCKTTGSGTWRHHHGWLCCSLGIDVFIALETRRRVPHLEFVNIASLTLSSTSKYLATFVTFDWWSCFTWAFNIRDIWLVELFYMSF